MWNIKVFLRCSRIANDLKIEQLSRITGVSKSYICEIEKGKKHPSQEVIEKYVTNLAFSGKEMEKIVDEIDSDSLEYRKILIYYLNNHYDMESNTKRVRLC